MITLKGILRTLKFGLIPECIFTVEIPFFRVKLFIGKEYQYANAEVLTIGAMVSRVSEVGTTIDFHALLNSLRISTDPQRDLVNLNVDTIIDSFKHWSETVMVKDLEV
jgi:hypothetical protein